MRKCEKKGEKKEFQFRIKKFGSCTDTEIGSWFRFPIPKSGFCCTLPLSIKGHRTTEALNYSHSQRSEVATSMESSSLNLTAQMIQNTKVAMNY